MFGLSHLPFYDLQTSPTAERNLFKLGSNSILAKLIRSSELTIADNERSVSTIAMNLTENDTTNNNNNNNSSTTNNNGSGNSSGGSGKCSPVITKNATNRSVGSPTVNGKNGYFTTTKGHNDNNPKYSHAETLDKSSELDSSVDSAKINNDPTEVRANSATIDTNSLKRLSSITTQTFGMQKRKYLKVISLLNQHNQHLELELTQEKRRRADELSKVIKSLLCFEAKLKHDKKVINQKLYERDTEIARLRALNRVLRKKYAAAAALVENRDDIDESLIYDDVNETDFGCGVAQNCPNCRREFYELSGKEVWTQTFVDERSSLDDHTENGSSSDETVSSSFYGARRSVRYTSKRNFRDYMRSRSMTIDDPRLENSEDNLSRDEVEDNDSNDNNDAYEPINGFSRKMERLHGVRRIESFTDEAELDSENEPSSSAARLMTNLRRSGLASKTPSTRSSINGGCGEYESDEIFTPNKSRTYRFKKFAETSPKQEFEASTDDWYASASDLDDTESLRAKPYGYNAVNPVLECVNQILLQQSMDECVMDGPPSLESSENASGSSGGGSSQQEGRSGSRKRVHFSIKNSMVHVPRDGRMISSPMKSLIDANDAKDCNLNYESIYSNEYERIGSEHNSSNLYVDMESKFGQEDRLMSHSSLSDKPQKKPPALPPKPANLIKFKRVLKNHSPVDSIQEDDPKFGEIISNNQASSEEPDYCSISEVNEAITSVQIVVDVHKSADDDMSSQTSEVALSQKTDDAVEIFADVPKLPNVAAIIVPKSSIKNKNNKTSVTDTFISRDTSMSNISLDTAKGTMIPIPNILAEINKKINSTTNHNTLSPPTTPSKTVSFSSIVSTSPAKIVPIIKMPQPSPTTPTMIHNLLPPPETDKLPMQAEFDWYNLDAEYGKSNQPDVIKETDANNSSPLDYHHSHHQMMMGTVNEVLDENDDSDSVQDAINHNGDATEDSVEYKLDEEFSLTNQPDIIKENIFETTTTTTTPSSRSSKAKSVCNGFPTIVDESPGNNIAQQQQQQQQQHQQNHRVKLNRKNFKNFLDTSGLSAKPLPRQRKIYFPGPFV